MSTEVFLTVLTWTLIALSLAIRWQNARTSRALRKMMEGGE